MTNQTSATDRPVRMPGTVLAAGVALLLHALIFAAGVVFLFLEAKSVTDHGQSGAQTYVGGGVMGIALVAGITLSAVMVLRGRLWARILGLMFEALFLLGGVIAVAIVVLVGPEPLRLLIVGLIYVALPIAIGYLLFTRSARAYLTS
ncbi:hypothetical protein [Flindersiella endophytica]